MLPHDELYHYGVRGMRWGIRKSHAERARIFQRKANEAAKGVREIGSRARTDSSGNTYLTTRDVSRANKLMRKSEKYQLKAQKQQKLEAKFKASLNKPIPNKDRKRLTNNVDRIIFGSVVGGIAGALIKPTFDVYGKRLASRVADRAKKNPSIFKYASKGLTKNVYPPNL